MVIPKARVAATVPVHPRWLFTTPVVLEPDVEKQPQFIPPKAMGSTEEELRHWMTAVAGAVCLAAHQAKGGTLVLMSSYDKVDLLGELLIACDPQLTSRLLFQRRSTPIGNLSHKFKALYASAERPIWIATGPAWTGLDLSLPAGLDPKLDNLLTDLVIPAVPFGLDRGTTHFARVKDIGFYAELMAAQRRWRQGIGRLVRQEGVQNRRLWVLDGRLQLSRLRHMDDFRAVLQAYPNRQRFVV
jgi:CRISPR type IV-associated DEAD/DEAH-box helicase Csf4